MTRKKVSELLPNNVIPLNEISTCYQAAAYMAAKRQDALLVVNANGELSGILTDRDLIYRLIAEDLDPYCTPIAKIMTKHPASVSVNDFALEALNKMVAGRFRHLPVIQETMDDFGAQYTVNGVFGILDITKCVYDQVEKLESSYSRNVKQLGAAYKSLADNLITTSNQEISSLLDKIKVPILKTTATVQEAAIVMKDSRATGVLVVDEVGKLVGVCTTKDLVLRVLAAKIHPEMTPLSRIMTPHPDFISPNTTILECLKQLHKNKYMHLPVVKDGQLLGMVDVLTLTYFILQELNELEGPEQPGPLWTKFWEATPLERQSMISTAHSQQSFSDDGIDTIAPDDSASMAAYPLSRNQIVGTDFFVFKFKDEVASKTYRFTSSIRDINAVKTLIAKKIFHSYDGNLHKDLIHLCYLDEDEDFVHLENDRDLEDGVAMAKAAGWRSLVLMFDRNRMKVKPTPLNKIYSYEFVQAIDPFRPRVDLALPVVAGGALICAAIYFFAARARLIK